MKFQTKLNLSQRPIIANVKELFLVRFIFLVVICLVNVNCGADNYIPTQNSYAEHSSSDLNSKNSQSSLLFKDQYIVCYAFDLTDEEQVISCSNKNEYFPIFMNITADDQILTLKILPNESSEIEVGNFQNIERKRIELWDECKQPNPPHSCKQLGSSVAKK